VLLRIFEDNSTEEREKWWTDIRQCRRRRQIALEPTMPITNIFTTASEYQFMEYKSAISRIQFELSERGMLVFDAFRAFNSSNSGLMTCSELYGGMEFLGIEFAPEQIYELVRRLAKESDGLVTYADFKRVFQGSEDELESRGIGGEGGGGGNFELVPPKPIPELTEITKAVVQEVIAVTDDILQSFKIKSKRVAGLLPEWNSQDTQSSEHVSIWSPSLQQSMLTSTKFSVCLGHYASRGFNNPWGRGGDKEKYETLHANDHATLRMNRSIVLKSVLEFSFQNPVRFKQIWHLSRGIKSMYAWKAVPPEGFAALGMVVTKKDEPPETSSMRCVPIAWVTPSITLPLKIWDDTGSLGGKPGSIWTINSLGLIAVVPGHEPPTEQFFDINAAKFDLVAGFFMSKANMDRER